MYEEGQLVYVDFGTYPNKKMKRLAKVVNVNPFLITIETLYSKEELIVGTGDITPLYPEFQFTLKLTESLPSVLYVS